MNTNFVESTTDNTPAEQLRARIASIAAAIITVDLQIRALPEGFSGSPFERIREQYECQRVAALAIPSQFLELVNCFDHADDSEFEEVS